MSYAKFDFHLHSCWSYDAVAEVRNYFELARERGVEMLALTEHHNIDSFAEVKETARDFPEIGYLCGAELTVYSEFGNTDMVCLNLPPKPTGDLLDVLTEYRQWQQNYGNAVSAALSEAGMAYSPEDRKALLLRYRPERTIAIQGITHVQNKVQVDYLVQERKYFASKEDFSAFLGNHELPHYPAASRVIPAVKQAGGLVFIAHPTRYFKSNDLNRMDALREVLNFDGIECAHDLVPPELTVFYREYCLKHKLLSTAGSDSHSVEGQQYRFGAQHDFARHIGEVRWRDEILERVTLYHA